MWNCPCCGDYRLDVETECYHCGIPRPPAQLPPEPPHPRPLLRGNGLPHTGTVWTRERHRRRPAAMAEERRVMP